MPKQSKPRNKTFKPTAPVWSDAIGNSSYNQRPNNAWQAPAVYQPKPRYNKRGGYC